MNHEKTIFKAIMLLHKEVMTVLSLLIPKAQADSVFDTYNQEMQKLTTEMDGGTAKTEENNTETEDVH